MSLAPNPEPHVQDSAADARGTAGSTPVNLALQVGNYALQVALSVPTAPIKPQAILPGLQALVDAVVGATQREVEGEGRSISCRAGCAACCRQAVSISAVEAYHVRDLVDAMPEPRRRAVEARFAAAAAQLKEAGLHAALMDPSGLSAPEREDLGLAYLALGIPCPFLESETCSIYDDRPLRCREYLVTSPPERCATPGEGDLDPVPVPRLSRTLMRIGADPDRPGAWPPLALALDWVAVHPDDLEVRPGPAWMRDILGQAGSPEPATPPAEDADEPAGIALPMPTGEVDAVDMLPTFRAYTEAAVGHAIAQSVAEGKPPSCRAGCAACCYHLLPISTIEARRIATVVDAMPEPRQAAVRARFADADSRIGAWADSPGGGLSHERSRDERLAGYFRLGIPCPLLENDQCSIYEERPLVCREYLVTSPAENCARLEDAGVVVEALPRSFTTIALAHLLSDDSPPVSSRILLPQSLRWVADNPEPAPPRRTADAWLNRFFERLRHVDTLIQPDSEAPSAREDTELKLDVPALPVPPRGALRALRAVTDLALRQAVERVEALGRHVSCRAGCSACCHQLVPIGAAEAHDIAARVAELPEPDRARVRARFAAAEARLAAWNRRADLEAVDTPRAGSADRLSLDYARLAIACPFLDDGLCSIHEVRPLACRERLVTSPAENCGHPGDAGMAIDLVPGPGASRALAQMAEDDGAGPRRIALTLALSWSAAHPDTSAALPGRIWVERFLARLRGLR